MAEKREIVVRREYAPDEEACACAIRALLDFPVGEDQQAAGEEDRGQNAETEVTDARRESSVHDRE
jgi:hypothetical protein